MKIDEWSKLEPELEFLTSWSRSRTKMDRLRNTARDNDSTAVFARIPRDRRRLTEK
jgi:hypothetical protein